MRGRVRSNDGKLFPREREAMNPETNKFEYLTKMFGKDEEHAESLAEELGKLQGEYVDPFKATLIRPDGTPVPKHWSIFQVDENYVINDYTFKCKYIGETSILFEPVGPIEIGKK
jgi:hypothetical protein